MTFLAEVPLLLRKRDQRGQGPSSVSIASIRFGGWQVHRVPGGINDHDAYLVKVNYDLHPGRRAPLPSTLDITFDIGTGSDDRPQVLDTVPRQVASPQEPSNYQLTGGLAFAALSSADTAPWPPGSPLHHIALPALSPTVSTHGIGTARPHWAHLGAGLDRVPAGSHSAWMVVQVPAGTQSLLVSAEASFTLPEEDQLGYLEVTASDEFTVWLPGTTRPATTRSVGPPDPDNLSRLCLALDATGYSNRAVLDQKAVQARLLRLSLALLADIGVDIGLVRQDAGDGTTLVLPPDVDPVRALPILLDRIAEHLLADNRDHADRIRLRVALAFGPVPHGDLGWIGQTVIETHRMLDSEQLRTHLDLDPESDLAVVLSSILYDLYVSPNFGTISPDAFTQEAIVHKKYQKPAWIWRRQRSA